MLTSKDFIQSGQPYAVPPAPTFAMRGFTLTEMAVVLAIVALLIGGMLAPMSAQQDARTTSETQTQMKSAIDSLLGFAVVQGRLPCPADPALGTGVEDCNLSQGTLPWTLLGIAQTDAWGRLLTYRVSTSFKDAISANTVSPPASCTTLATQASFSLCSEGDILITNGTATPATLADKIPAVIISHGINGRGAYLPGGTQLAAGTGNELENSETTNATFVSKTPDPEFDDLVVWIPWTILVNRMISAGKLP